MNISSVAPSRNTCALALALFAVCVVAVACGDSDTARTDSSATTSAADVAAPREPPNNGTATPRRSDEPPTPPASAFIIESAGVTYAVDRQTATLTPIMRFPRDFAEDVLAYLHLYAVSPDGRSVAAGCSADGTLLLIRPDHSAANICVFTGGDPTGHRIASQTDFVRGNAIGSPWFGGDPFYWSPDGTKLVFYVDIGERYDDAYVADVASGSVMRVIENSGHAHLTAATWSPDSSHFAIAPLIDGPPVTSLLVVDAVTGEQVNLVTALGPDARASATVTWSPDSKSVAFTAFERAPTTSSTGPADLHIYVEAAAGTNVQQVATGGLPATGGQSLIWSPDGRWLAALLVTGKYPDAMAAIEDAYLLRVDGGEQRELGQNLTPLAIGWSPGGRDVAIWARGREGYTFAIAPMDNATPARFIDAVLAPVPSPLSLYPIVSVWSLDQKTIFYSILACGQGGCTPGPLFAIDVNGGTPRQLSDKPVDRFIGYTR